MWPWQMRTERLTRRGAFFVAQVVELGELVPNAECIESRLFDVEEARRQPGWIDHNEGLFNASVDAWRGQR